MNRTAASIINEELYIMQKPRTGFVQFVMQINELPVVFQTLPFLVATALGLTGHAPLATLFIVVECVAPLMPYTDVADAEELHQSGQMS